jgi:hypothetical protein
MSDKVMLDTRVSQAKLAEILKYMLKTQIPTNRSEFGRMIVDTLHGILKKNGLIEEVPAKFYEEYWKGHGTHVPDVKIEFEQTDEQEEKRIMEILNSNKQERSS